MGHLCTIRANLGPRPHREWVGWSTCAWPAAPRDLAQSFLPSLALTHEIMLATRKVFAPTTGANWVSGSERAQCGCGCCTSEICTRWHRRRSAHCMRTVPRGRVCQETEPGNDPRLSTTRFFALLALLSLLPTTCNFHFHPSYCHWPSTRHASSTGEASDTSFPERETVVSACTHSRLPEAICPSPECSAHTLAEFLRCKRGPDRSFEDPPDRREFPLAEAPTTFVDRHDFPRSSDRTCTDHTHRPRPHRYELNFRNAQSSDCN
jgi:hypothetical protein